MADCHAPLRGSLAAGETDGKEFVMKPYPNPGACRGDCQQGRAQCQTEALCRVALHRVVTTNGGAFIDNGERKDMPITMEDDETSALSWALFLVVVAFAVGIVALPFLLGAA